MLCSINITDWIQAMCAVATLIVALIVMYQGNKIKTLTDVVTSLNEQARISQQLLSFEMRSRINDVQPNFITHTNKWENDSFSFSVKNTGQRARDFGLEKGNNIDRLEVNNLGNKVVVQDSVVGGLYTLIDNNLPFSFRILYDDNNGQHFFQTVNSFSNKRLKIELPQKLDSI